MATLLEKVSRYLPLILVITAVAAPLQVALQVGHVFSSKDFGVWLNRNGNLIWWTFAGACFVAWTLAILAIFRKVVEVKIGDSSRKTEASFKSSPDEIIIAFNGRAIQRSVKM